MKKPNDKKRPNTHSGNEDRARKRNLNYIWVSKPIIEIEEPLTKVKHTIPHPKGRTYRKLDHAFRKPA